MNGQPQKKPTSKSKIALGWAILIVNIIFWTGLSLWWFSSRHRGEENVSFGVGFSIFMMIVAGFFLVCGAAGYVLILFTECLTFNYQNPVWNGFKVRLYFANIVVPLCGMLGMGLVLCAFATPVLSSFGLQGPMAYLIPILGSLVVMQICLIWVNVWKPITSRLITKRLKARGITDGQMTGGMFMGLSNPARSSFKKFAAVEEDVGMLWFHPEQLIYWGDNDQFAVRREQLCEVERSMDSGSSSLLSGTVHVILRFTQADGGERRVRLHTEDHWTLGSRRSAMEELAKRIETWRTSGAPAPAPTS